MSVSLGNAIRSLKVQISSIDIDLPEHAVSMALGGCVTRYSTYSQAKTELYSRIDQYLQERILAAGIAISTFGMAKIHDGDVVLTYARFVYVSTFCAFTHPQTDLRWWKSF